MTIYNKKLCSAALNSAFCSVVRIRLIAVAAQKFIADVSNDVLQYAFYHFSHLHIIYLQLYLQFVTGSSIFLTYKSGMTYAMIYSWDIFGAIIFLCNSICLYYQPRAWKRRATVRMHVYSRDLDSCFYTDYFFMGSRRLWLNNICFICFHVDSYWLG